MLKEFRDICNGAQKDFSKIANNIEKAGNVKELDSLMKLRDARLDRFINEINNVFNGISGESKEALQFVLESSKRATSAVIKRYKELGK